MCGMLQAVSTSQCSGNAFINKFTTFEFTSESGTEGASAAVLRVVLQLGNISYAEEFRIKAKAIKLGQHSSCHCVLQQIGNISALPERVEAAWIVRGSLLRLPATAGTNCNYLILFGLTGPFFSSNGLSCATLFYYLLALVVVITSMNIIKYSLVCRRREELLRLTL